jgi:anti-sigma-K factor RskA
MRARRVGLHTLVGAYVLDAVSDTDRAEFERHLLTCEQCRDDVRGLREASARLGAATAIKPRPGLRAPTIGAVRGIRQLPPVTGEAAAAGRRWRWRPAGQWSRPWLAAAATGVAVVLAITAIVLGLHLGGMQQRLAAQDRRDAAITAILGAHDATAMTAAVRTGGTATVVMSHRADALVFTAAGLPSLSGVREYELWLTGPSGTTSAGALPPSRHGMSGPMVVGRLAHGDQLELTVEPAGGSPQPTSPPVVRLVLGI